MIEELWLYPPLAFARLGPSDTPCDAFTWGPNDQRPRGTGKTTVLPATTLHVAADGTVSQSEPQTLQFKDAAGWRPVCPFFELHGRWTDDGATTTGRITVTTLQREGIALADVTWSVAVANLKPYHFTLNPADRIEARVEIAGDASDRRALLGVTPGSHAAPLATSQAPVPLGWVQATRPTDDFPELLLRFTPARGDVYGPTDLASRTQEFVLPAERLILNPAATWCRFRPTEDDPRTNPGGLFASDARRVSVGLVDDVCDGLVSCEIPGVGTARARIVVGPPNYAPDRRPFTSLADGLKDRVQRDDVHDPAYVEDLDATTQEVRDLMERVFETMGLSNVDYQNARARSENRGVAESLGLPPDQGENKAFPIVDPLPDQPLPWTEVGRRQHRRFLALEVFEDLLRERPGLIDDWIREPGTSDRYYDRRMPALYRGSDRYPMHITRRQRDLLRMWAERLRRDTEANT